jgi:hypothetical protein
MVTSAKGQGGGRVGHWEGPVKHSGGELDTLTYDSDGRCKIIVMQDWDHIAGREPGSRLEVTVHLMSFPTRRGTKVTFDIDTEEYMGRVMASSRTASGRTKTNINTQQYYDSRIIEAYEDWSGTKDDLQEAFERLDSGWVEKAAHDYAKQCAKQAGLSERDFDVNITGDMSATIDMENWPEGLGFDSWFSKWARKWDIEVHD